MKFVIITSQRRRSPKIKAWSAPCHVHCTPTSASFINQVERSFAELPESGSVEVFTPLSGSSKPISTPSSIGTTKIRSPSKDQLLTKSWLQRNASATKRSVVYGRFRDVRPEGSEVLLEELAA
jgi:hypothetical protein